MIVPAEDSGSGLSLALVGLETQEICKKVHSAFLAKHGIAFWALYIVGSQQIPGQYATSNPPDGHEGVTKTITKTFDLAEDLMAFLDHEHAEWVKRTQNSN
jgi:hypothetical protein